MNFLETACQNIEKDDGFRIDTDGGKLCIVEAKKLLLRIQEKEEYLFGFSDWLVVMLRKIIYSQTRLDKISMWSKFHEFRSSKILQQKWERLLEAKERDLSLFYQNITLQVFEALLKLHHPLEASQQQAALVSPAVLTFEEENAIRYVGGYIVHKLKEECDEGVSLSLSDMEGDMDVEAADSELWTACIDRGGLTYITDAAFRCFCEIEYCLRTFMNTDEAHQLADRDEISASIACNEDVLFNWATVSVEMDDDVSDKLLELIIHKWITIRGFSFAKSILELYKLEIKKGIQKKKGLRSRVSNDHEA